MIDIHSHILFDTDDGAKTIEESIEILKGMNKCGFDSVILTPHYIKNSAYNCTAVKNWEKFQALKERLKSENFSMNLFLGNEIFIDDDILELLKKHYIIGLNNSEYLLIEIPMNGKYEGYKDIFYLLIRNGYKIVLAHPERYLSFQQDFNKIYELEKIGVYFQCNLGSIVGKYGEAAEKTIKRILKERKLSFLATDIHHPKQNYQEWKKAKDIALKYISEDEFNILVEKNPKQLLS